MKKVILIGGAPFTGKSTLARELAAKFNYACISTDDLGTAVKAISPDPAFNPMKDLPHWKYYQEHTVQELFDHTILYHQKLMPSVKAVIEGHSKTGYPAVIEGWALYPDWVDSLPYENIDSLWLTASKVILKTRVLADKLFYSDVPDPDIFINHYSERNVWLNKKIEADAKSLGMKIIEIDSNTDRENLLLNACKQLQT
ncbi:MAG: hypothetical protein EHM58_00285 [Ignavibacteriae bacterium]|nr:MAG: hypothetical protein EHM58_00285 [Ignavibacteriota bacterium]